MTREDLQKLVDEEIARTTRPAEVEDWEEPGEYAYRIRDAGGHVVGDVRVREWTQRHANGVVSRALQGTLLTWSQR